MLVDVRSPGEQLGERPVQLSGRRSNRSSELAAQWCQAGVARRDGNAETWSHVRYSPVTCQTVRHNGSSFLLVQSGSTNFGEKFSRVKFSPSLTLFGGKPMEGWMAVTVSGLVTVSLLKPGGALLTASESLCRLRGRVALADIAFTGGGNIVVAATDGSSSSPVQFYKVRNPV